MSLKAMLWALDEAATGDPAEVMILVALADEANSDGLECFPELRRIARRARVSEPTVRRRIASMEERGLIVVVRPERQGRGHFNRYGLVMGDRSPAEVRAAVEAGADTYEKGCQPGTLSRTVKASETVAQGDAFSPVKASKSVAHGRRKPVRPEASPNPPLFAGHDLPSAPLPAPPNLSMLRNQLNKRKPKP